MNGLPDLGERLLRLREVERKTGLSSTTIYRRMAEGKFPVPLELGSGTVRWRESRIDDWINSLSEKQPAKAVKTA